MVEAYASGPSGFADQWRWEMANGVPADELNFTDPERCSLAYYRWHGSPRMYYSAYDTDVLAALKQRLDASRALGIPVTRSGGGPDCTNVFRASSVQGSGACLVSATVGNRGVPPRFRITTS